MPTITPFLWFNGQAEQAAKFYASVFKGSKILGIARYTKGTPGKLGSVMTVRFRILGQDFTALNGGPEYTFNPAISLMVECNTQKEIDYYWRRLTAGGKEVQCGWLVDKFGVSWQIVPKMIMKLLADDKPARTERMMNAVMTMVKLDVAQLRRAAKGR
jgi:predicted 3-demethylubiquinone-9 3-methyltransferase (glyoxalase superfamily)